MASEIVKTVNEIQRYFTTQKIKGEKITYWKYFTSHLDSEDPWDEEFLYEVIVTIGKFIKKFDSKRLSQLWEDSVSFKEFRGDKKNAPKEKIVPLLSDELLDRIMDKLELNEFPIHQNLSQEMKNWNNDDIDEDFLDEDDEDDILFDDADNYIEENF